MDALVMVLFFIIVVGVWWWLAKRMASKGRHWLLRHFAGSTAGMFSGLVVVALALAVGLIEPAPGGADHQVTSEVPAAEVAELSSLYVITRDDLHAPYKRTVEVGLQARLNEAQLGQLAKTIKAMDSTKVERTFIGYRLDSQEAGSSYWATTHYNPDLTVSVHGLSAAEIQALASADLRREGDELVGSWIVERGFSHTVAVYKRGDGYVKIDAFPDGSRSDDQPLMGARLGDGSLRLEEPENDFGEYFTIDPEGNLRFWSENGNYYTAAPRASA